jgi:hypothetical protein
LVHVYKADFGALDEDYHRDAMRNCSSHLKKMIGPHMSFSGYIFAMQLYDDDELMVESHAKGQQCEVNIRHHMSFSLDQS